MSYPLKSLFCYCRNEFDEDSSLPEPKDMKEMPLKDLARAMEKMEAQQQPAQPIQQLQPEAVSVDDFIIGLPQAQPQHHQQQQPNAADEKKLEDFPIQGAAPKIVMVKPAVPNSSKKKENFTLTTIV